jgi:1-acyl-sn-glycerol-3-phosphate acyltransferase
VPSSETPPSTAQVVEPETPPLDPSFLAALGPAELRALLPGFLAGFVADPATAAAVKARMTNLLAEWTDDDCRLVLRALADLGSEHRLYPALAPTRALSREWCRDVVLEPRLHGVEHLRAAVESGPVLLVGNHLSYFDTSATDAVLAWAGHVDLADRLCAAAGPKVYSDLFRRIASACLNTLPVPQSTSLAHTQKLSARELARKANESLEAAQRALTEGYLLIVYPEGSRSRTGHLGPFLRGVHRYLSCVAPMAVVPFAISGTEHIMPITSRSVFAGPVMVRFGPALRVDPEKGSRDLLAASHGAVASLLPEHLAPSAGTPATV